MADRLICSGARIELNACDILVTVDVEWRKRSIYLLEPLRCSLLDRFCIIYWTRFGGSSILNYMKLFCYSSVEINLIRVARPSCDIISTLIHPLTPRPSNRYFKIVVSCHFEMENVDFFIYFFIIFHNTFFRTFDFQN